MRIEKTQKFVLWGHLNARTGTLPDHNEPDTYVDEFSDHENDLYVLTNCGFDLTRYSMDKARNNYGYRLL